MIFAQLSDAAAGAAADVLKAPAAQGAEPQLYLVLLFAGLMIAGIVGLMLRYARGMHTSFVEYVQSHDVAEDQRMRVVQEINDRNNAQAQKNLETVVACATRCESTLRDIDRWHNRSTHDV